jgi:hypothetical protein
VYRRPAAPLPAPNEDEGLRWQHVVISFQTLLDCPVVVGGRKALETPGICSLSSAAGPREIHLYGDQKPPGWVPKLKLDTRLASEWIDVRFGGFRLGVFRMPSLSASVPSEAQWHRAWRSQRTQVVGREWRLLRHPGYGVIGASSGLHADVRNRRILNRGISAGSYTRIRIPVAAGETRFSAAVSYTRRERLAHPSGSWIW